MHSNVHRSAPWLAVLLALSGPASAQSAAVGETVLVSLSTTQSILNGPSFGPSISLDGRYVAFLTADDDVDAGDSNGVVDAYLRDRVDDSTTRISIGMGGADANGETFSVRLSDSGRYAIFRSLAANLVPGDTNGDIDLFLRDLEQETTVRVSVSAAGLELPQPAIAFDEAVCDVGPLVAFTSSSNDVVPGDSNGEHDLFLFDAPTAAITRVTIGSMGEDANGPSLRAAISANGRYVAFSSRASNFFAPATSPSSDYQVYVHDRQNASIELVSTDNSGNPGLRSSTELDISGDGRFVAFESEADNLVSGDFNGDQDVFVRDRLLGRTERVSVHTLGFQANRFSGRPRISNCGRFVIYSSPATNLVTVDGNGSDEDVFLHDRQRGETTLVSVDSNGAQVNSHSVQAEISGDGSGVTFRCGRSLAPDDTNNDLDVFYRQVSVPAGPDTCFSEYCIGTGGDTMGCTPCPCGNDAPAGSAGGCLNSNGNSARLVPSGLPSLSSDTLRFDMLGGSPSSFALLISGAARAPTNPASPCLGTDSGVPSTALDGLRCTVQGVLRHGIRPTDLNGDAGLNGNGWGFPSGPPGGLITQGGFRSGQSRHFQVFYRTSATEGCMRGQNTTQSVSVHFEP